MNDSQCMLLEDEDRDFDPSPYPSLNLEFELLSDITGNEIFREKTKQILKYCKSFPKEPQSWIRNSVVMDYLEYRNEKQRNWSLEFIAQSGGNYLEYLLKAWIIGGRQNEFLRENYIRSTEKAIKDLIVTSNGGLVYATVRSNERYLRMRMAHSTCYIGRCFLRNISMTFVSEIGLTTKK